MAQFAAPLPAPDDASADNAGFVWHTLLNGRAVDALGLGAVLKALPNRAALPTAARYPGMPADRYFGVTMPIPQAGWNRFEMSLQANAPVQRLLDALNLCPALDTLQGPPLEHVVMMRDEMANMVWGIEKRVQRSSGEPINRKFESTRLSTNQTLRPAADGSRPRPCCGSAAAR